MTIQQKIKFAGNRFAFLNRAELGVIVSFAERGIAAARTIAGLPSDTPIDLDQVPIQPFLFGDDPAGRRVMVETEVWVDRLQRKIRVTVEASEFADMDEIAAIAEREAARIIGESPTGFGLPAGSEIDPKDVLQTSAVFIERRF